MINLHPSLHVHTVQVAFAVTFILSRLRTFAVAAYQAVTHPYPCPFPCPFTLESYHHPFAVAASLIAAAQATSGLQVGLPPLVVVPQSATQVLRFLLAVVPVELVQSYLNQFVFN